ncbi:MAG: ATP-binding protein [Candidatus Methanofastidiosia archaeon]
MNSNAFIAGLVIWIILGTCGSLKVTPDESVEKELTLQWSEDFQLTEGPGEDHSIFLLNDHNGTLWAVWVAATYTGEDILYRTFDGEWSSGLRITSSGLDDSDPSLIQDSEGAIWVAWTSSRTRDLEIYVKTFDGSWSDDERLTNHSGDDLGPTLFQDASGTIWVAWSSFRDDNYEIVCREYDGSWSDDILLTESSAHDYSPMFLQDSAGTIWVFWVSAVVDNWEVHYRTYDGTWSNEESLCTNRQIKMNYSALVDSSSGAIWVFWDSLHEENYEIHYRTHRDSWSEETQLTTVPGHDENPSAMQGADGTIWVAWDSEREFGNKDIYCKNYHGEWSDDIRLTDQEGIDSNPHIIEDSSGTVWVFWNSERGTNKDIYYKTGQIPATWWIDFNIILIFAMTLFLFPLSYTWYRIFPVSFNRFAWTLTGGRLAPFKEINPNPYVAGSPLRSGEMFFGRTDVFDYLSTRLKSGPGVAIVLYGQRRTGKTSVLFRIKEGRLGSEFIPIFIDIQAIPSKNDRQLLCKVAGCMIEALGDYELESSLESLQCMKKFREEDKWINNDPYSTFDSFLESCLQLSGEKCLLVMFDEYDRLAAMIRDKNELLEITGYFRNWMQMKKGFSFIFAGTHELEKLESYWSLLFNGALYRKISALEKEDALALMKRPVRGLVRYSTEAREEILHLTSCNPWLLQLMLQCLVDHVNIKRNYRITSEDIEFVVSDLIKNSPPHFTNLWEDSQDLEKVVLSAAAGFPLESIEISREEILTELAQTGLGDKEAKEILEELVRKDILERSRTGNTYFFGLELYRHWIAYHHPFSRIKEGLS